MRDRRLWCLVPVLVLILGASRGRATCGKPLREDLSVRLREAYPDAQVVTLEMLSARHRALYSKDHPGGCPGAVRLDFLGDGSEAFAILLVDKSKLETILILAKRARSHNWDLVLIQRGDARPVPVIWREHAAEYDDLWKEKKLTPKGEVLVIAGYESWARAYGWDGNKVDWVQVSD